MGVRRSNIHNTNDKHTNNDSQNKPTKEQRNKRTKEQGVIVVPKSNSNKKKQGWSNATYWSESAW